MEIDHHPIEMPKIRKNTSNFRHTFLPFDEEEKK
jgi:hypothetical protein